MNIVTRKNIKEFFGLLVSQPIDPRRQASRIGFMEENVFLPVKAFIIGLLFWFIYLSGAFPLEKPVEDPSLRTERQVSLAQARAQLEDTEPGLPLHTVRQVYWAYVTVNLVGAVFLVLMRRFWISFIQWVVFSVNFVDAVFLASLTVLTGVMKDAAYWFFLGLIIRNAVSVPVPPLQMTLNLLTIAAYTFAGVVDQTLVDLEIKRLDWGEVGRSAAGMVGDVQYLQAFAIRIFLMLLLMACCYGVQILFDRQREAEEEVGEFVVRQEQLQTAGRLSAEVAHQIKNPLAIINNAVFLLQRSVQEGKGDSHQQLNIIRDEVERADRIITELIGYAQLAEGRIEKLDVAEEVDRALEQVFPPQAHYEVQIRRHYAPGLPPLQMQRSHLREIFMNLLINAREATHGKGVIEVQIHSSPDYQVQVAVRDNGPGIAPDRIERIFEPYVTTKEKGSGLGLAIVKHNAEIYGGTVRVESALGKGSTFVVTLPARTMMRLRK